MIGKNLKNTGRLNVDKIKLHMLPFNQRLLFLWIIPYLWSAAIGVFFLMPQKIFAGIVALAIAVILSASIISNVFKSYICADFTTMNLTIKKGFWGHEIVIEDLTKIEKICFKPMLDDSLNEFTINLFMKDQIKSVCLWDSYLFTRSGAPHKKVKNRLDLFAEQCNAKLHNQNIFSQSHRSNNLNKM